MADSTPGERSINLRLIGLLIAFAALAVLVVWMWRGAPTEPDLDEGRAVAEQFLKLIRSGKPQQAWESTTAEFKSAEGRESFLSYVKDHSALGKPLSFVSVQTVMLQDSPRAEYIYRSQDNETTVRLLAGNELGAWRVDRLTID